MPAQRTKLMMKLSAVIVIRQLLDNTSDPVLSRGISVNDGVVSDSSLPGIGL